MNSSDQYDIDTLIVRYLDGDATSEEQEVLNSWIVGSEANRRQFEEVEQIWKMTSGTQEVEKIDTEANWQRFKHTTGIEDKPVRTLKQKPDRSRWYKIAAVLVVAIGVSLFWFFNSSQETVLIAEETQQFDLPDGSIIWLKEGSSLSYSNSDFNKEAREVYLEGEGYFEVTHNTNKPFIVFANNSETKVLGTTFTVSEDTIHKTTSVALLTGKVAFKTDIENEILEPGESSTASYTGVIKKKKTDDLNLLAWKTKTLHFEATPLKKVVQDLNKVYSKTVRLENKSIQDCTLTINFENESLDKVLQTLQILFDVEVDQEGSDIRLLGGSCQK